MRRALILIAGLSLAVASCGEAATEDTAASSSTTQATTVATTEASTTTTTQPATTTTTEPGEILSVDSKVSLRAIGPIVIGMTLEEARAAAGMRLSGELDPEVSDTCFYVVPESTVKGVLFMVFEDVIARVEITAPSPITTRSGAGVGSTREELAQMYSGNLEDTDEAVFDGEAVGFVPNDESDANYRIFFELDENDVVVRYRMGIKPAVDFIEGCA